MKKIFSMFLAVLTIITTMAVPVISSPTVVMAATSWPSVSASSYVEFTAQKTINVFKDSSCKTRGTSSPSKAYNAFCAAERTPERLPADTRRRQRTVL